MTAENTMGNIIARIFVVIGVVLTILSAVVMHVVVAENEVKIEEHKQTITQTDNFIAHQWQNINRFQANMNTALLLQGELRNTYQRNVLGLSEPLPPTELINYTEEKRTAKLDSINDKYFDVIEAESAIIALEKDNNWFSTLALVTQLIGLILVLARDIAR